MGLRTWCCMGLLLGCSGDGDLETATETGSLETATEAFEPLAGFGALSGDCAGLIDGEELLADAPFWFSNALDLGASEPTPDDLSEEGQRIYETENLGGSSVWSEVLAFEVLRRCDLAMLLKTESEIVYVEESKKTDFLVQLDGAKVGVSVTRAFHYPPTEPYTVEDAQSLLEKKLGDIPLASAAVGAEDAWEKQILHVIAYDHDHVETLRSVWDGLDAGLRGDTVVVITVTDGDDAFVY